MDKHADTDITAYQEVLKSYEQIKSSLELKSSPRKILSELCKCKLKILQIIRTEENEITVEALLKLKEQLDNQISFIKKKIQLELAIDVPNHAGQTSTDVVRNNISEQINLTACSQSKESTLQSLMNQFKVKPHVSGLNELAGLSYAKKTLKSLIITPIRQPQLFSGRKPINTILLFGPPGTGKTKLAQALAAESQMTLYSITSANILNQFMGESEKIIQSIFRFAIETTENSIIFIDEIDGLFQKRTSTENQHCRRLKTELLCQLSYFETCKKCFLICATNCPWDLDTAFLRRFHKRIYIPLPNSSDRRELLHLLTKNTDLECTSECWSSILEMTEGYSSSDISNIISHTLNIPILELEDNTSWKMIEGSKYVPAFADDKKSNIIFQSLDKLPVNSVKARKVEFLDMLVATAETRRTITDEDIEKYEEYLK